jgi:RimJ/RimL family protein N-acetyltransferase
MRDGKYSGSTHSPRRVFMIESERLIFREFNLDDLPTLIEQRSDPDVNKYLGGTKLQNPEALAKRIRFYMSCYESTASVCVR